MIKVQMSLGEDLDVCIFTFRNFEEFDRFVNTSEEDIKIYDIKEDDK